MMKKRRFGKIWAGLLFLAFALSCMATASTDSEDDHIIRVGYPVQARLTQLDENGKYSGYSYEYLQEIAQYTGWSYEFVTPPGDSNESILATMQMLEDGELDLVSGMLYSDALAKTYDYSAQGYGTAHTVLYALYDNTAVDRIYSYSAQKLRIAMFEGAKTRNAELEAFCTINNIAYEPVYCDSDAEQYRMLLDGRADAMLSRDLLQYENVRNIASFAPSPFYFVTGRGNGEIMQQLNAALLSIGEADPYFSTKLHEKYFNAKGQELFISDEDRAFISGAGTLRVGAVTDSAPFQYIGASGSVEGVSIDLLSDIRDRTGLAFEVVPVSTYEELKQGAAEGAFDLIAGLVYNHDLAQELNAALTRPFASAQYVMLLGADTSAENLTGKRLAMPEWFSPPVEYVGSVMRFPTLQNCLDAVVEGKADYTYANGYTVQYYINRPKYRALRLVPQSTPQQYEACFGVVKPVDPLLLGILNKAVLAVSPEFLQSSVYKHTVLPEAMTLRSILEANPVPAIGFIVVLAVFIIGFLSWILRTRMRLNRQISLEIQRYRQVFDLSNEQFFEYDYARDLLKIARHGQGGELAAEQRRRFLKLVRAEADGVAEGRLNLFSDEARWMRVTTRTVRDANGHPVYAIGKVADIHEEKREKDALLAEAQRDGLTQLYNAAAIRSRICEAVGALRAGEQDALVILDVDHFKTINDEFGHFTGDCVLRSVADALRTFFRSEDSVGRLGGDEFMVYMRHMSDRKALADKCAALCQAIHQIRVPDSGRCLTVSVGAAIVLPGEGYESLYKEADKALYEAKDRGRDGYVVA